MSDGDARTRAKARAVHADEAPLPPLTVSSVVRAAITLADTSGIRALSMARVAEQLGRSTMALYRHVDSKDQLTRLMQDAVWADAPMPDAPGWRARAREWTTYQLDVYRAHPWLLDLPISPPDMPGQLRLVDAGLASLEGTPLPVAERLASLMLLSGVARMLAGAVGDLGADDAGRQIAQAASDHGSARLADAVEHGALDGVDMDVVGFGIDTVLAGIEARFAH